MVIADLSLSMDNPKSRVNILGVGVSAINLDKALQVIDAWIETRKANYVCVTGVHGIMESHRDEKIRAIHNRAGLVTPDGMPLVWISHLKGLGDVSRVYGPDLTLALCEYSQSRGYRHFFYGGAKGVPELMAKHLMQRFPGLIIAGTFSPPFRNLTKDEDVQIVKMIQEAQPDIVWVGLSTPKQERWIAEHNGQLGTAVLIGVGGAFDIHAGLKKQAPRWMQNIGLEWLFRLKSEPRRLWRRYLINNPLFILLLLGQCLGLKRYSLEIDDDVQQK